MPEEIQTLDGVDFQQFCVLQSNDEPQARLFKVSRNVASMSIVIRDMIKNEEEPVVPLIQVKGDTLALVVEYMEYHSNQPPTDIPRPLRGPIRDLLCEFDQTFIFTKCLKDNDEKQHDTLIDVILAANFLQIRELRDLSCATVASMIKGKTPDQIQALFNIDSDFTPEEEERIREENRWCEES